MKNSIINLKANEEMSKRLEKIQGITESVISSSGEIVHIVEQVRDICGSNLNGIESVSEATNGEYQAIHKLVDLVSAIEKITNELKIIVEKN